MSFEQIKIIDEAEEIKSFEELEYTRNFGVVNTLDVKKILKEHSDYWRLPAVSELYALRKQNKKNFFNQKSYWAKDPVDPNISNNFVEVYFGRFGNSTLFFPDENKTHEKHLVLVKNDTAIEHADEETKEILENYLL